KAFLRSRTENTLAPQSILEKSPKFGRLKLSQTALLLRSLKSATMRTPPEGFGKQKLEIPKAHMKFPPDYPYSPPSVRFLTKVWHPNVYENGDLCISILHPPVDDPHSGELPCERWNPTQSVRTVLLSVISLLNEPNTYSPANVDASVMYRRFRDSKGKDKEYENIIR
ncbi:Ubiquitin-conjugating enzyme E2 R2, partial [Armadillidium vulgare]